MPKAHEGSGARREENAWLVASWANASTGSSLPGRSAQAGKTPSYPDSQIAAIAAVNKLVLVTRNVDDFADFQGLLIENWFEDRTD